MINGVTSHGFTGHEHLQSGLIHMNGRAYDPAIGRFLSVDPFIAMPENGQSINPYSYVMNNPLKYTDPSAYVAEDTTSSANNCSVQECADQIETILNSKVCVDGCTVIGTRADGSTYTVVKVKGNGSAPSSAQSSERGVIETSEDYVSTNDLGGADIAGEGQGGDKGKKKGDGFQQGIKFNDVWDNYPSTDHPYTDPVTGEVSKGYGISVL